MISHYYYSNKYRKKLSFDTWYKNTYKTNDGWNGGCKNSPNSKDVTNNFMSRYLGFNYIDEITEKNIKDRYYFIVILEDDNKYKKLSKILNINISNIPIRNKSKIYCRNKLDISEETIKLFNENNKMDIKLYELVCQIY